MGVDQLLLWSAPLRQTGREETGTQQYRHPKRPVILCVYISRESIVKEIGTAKFREQCLALLDQLDADGLIVTKRGKPVARVVPYDSQEAELIGSLRHKIEVRGDLSTTGLRWDADAQP